MLQNFSPWDLTFIHTGGKCTRVCYRAENVMNGRVLRPGKEKIIKCQFSLL